MQKAVSVAVMRESDKQTIAALGDSKILMERAGRAIFESVASWRRGDKEVTIVCGTGNNAGDGYVLAKCLREADVPVSLLLITETFSPDGRYFFDRARAAGVPFTVYNGIADFSDSGVIVDCIFGTGFHGAVTGAARALMEAINASDAYVVSADTNSGLNGDTGLGELFVRSDITVAIGFVKQGQILNQGRDAAGALVCANIGINCAGDYYNLPETADFRALLGDRPHFSHKGMWGYVALLGGCRSYAGAAKLANLSAAALRSGCGVVRLAVPACIADGVLPYLLESTLYEMSDENGMMKYDPAAIDGALNGVRAAAVGMGWGACAAHEQTLAYILEHYAISLIIDADALNALARMGERGIELLRFTKCRVILTPHLKEFERLSGVSVEKAQKNPVEHAAAFARKTGAVVLLKGTGTVITDGETTYLVNRGSAGMATAGSGDVLSGILAGLCGYCSADALTATLGAWLAGATGEYAEASSNPVSMTASDTVRKIVEAVSMILDKSEE